MLVSEIQQLNESSIRFLIDRLKLGAKTDEEASAEFKGKVSKAVAIKRRRIDSVVHNLMDEWKKGKRKKKAGGVSSGKGEAIKVEEKPVAKSVTSKSDRRYRSKSVDARSMSLK
jgi:hypothetical protein